MKNAPVENSIVNDDIRTALQAFSARLAHDFNNLLTPLLAYPDMIAADLPIDSRALGLLRSLETATESAVCITRRLADLSGLLRSSKRSFLLGDVVESVLGGLKKLTLASGVRIEKDVVARVEVFMSQDALSLALEELCRNALVAQDGAGSLSVRVVDRLQYEVPFESAGGLVPAGVYRAIKVQDDGIGMSEEVLQKAMEPFYSGFGGGKRCGGGLGLSIALCALRENGAYLVLESNAGCGTTATILIPYSAAPAVVEGVPKPLVGAAVPSGDDGQPRILVVDDEPSIANLFKMILEGFIQGVAVDKAANGAEALALFNARRHAVIVMDLHMPVMDGQTAFLEIESSCGKNGWPMPSVVFCTGYAPRDVVQKAISVGEQHTLLNKPVRSEILVQAVQKRLKAIL